MLEENKNLKVTEHSNFPPSFDKWRAGEGFVSYSKTSKLVTALYMVTDIMDKEEPLRNKLRTLGINIISDINSTPDSVNKILSLLDIASAVGMISEMNCNILKKEFSELKKTIAQDSPLRLEEFLSSSFTVKTDEKESENSIRRIGIQKGSTLMKALNKIEMSNKTISLKNNSAPYEAKDFRSGFDVLKKQRRELILKIIKVRPAEGGDKAIGHSIKDIVSALRGHGEKWGEKTLQRELVSMVQDGVLNKTGEKRWSKYSLK